MTEPLPKLWRILAIDDEEIVQSLIRDALEDEGHQVLTAASGEEAIKLLESTPFDLLITDIRMPRMSGTELVERARQINPGIGIIFITGYASLTSAKDAIKQGALDYIMKPFELSEIRQAVRNAISKLSVAAAAASHEQLSSLSDLSNVLFAAGDRKSLAMSSLRFAMMHLRCESGSILFWDGETEQYIRLTIRGEETDEQVIGDEPMRTLANKGMVLTIREPALVTELENHPIYQHQPDPGLQPFLMPPWMDEQIQMIAVPVMRASAFHGLMMLAHDEDTVKIKGTDLKFLAITANQLAITLENVSLLEETQQAYSRLKELQDETIELEKMATRGTMSAEIGHELNNFLGVVAGNVDLLKLHLEKQNYDRLDKYLSTVSSTLAKIKTFTDSLMDLSSISSKKETIRFDRLITEVVEYLRPQKRFEGVEISMPAEIEPVALEADNTQLQQLLYNLFHNAADATIGCEQRQISVSLATDPQLNSFQVAIRDTGVGFNPESLSKAFQEKFTTKESGHGFGLVVCKRIVDIHGGELQIESVPGGGACISITFPLAVEAIATQPIPIG